MNKVTKLKIKELTGERIAIAGSQNRYAKSIGVSEAQVSNLMTNKWAKISAEMWRKLADACGYVSTEWQIESTSNFNLLVGLLQDAKDNANVYSIVASAGAGKSRTSTYFKESNRNVFRVECAEYWNKKAFLIELLKSMGLSTEGLTIYALMAALEESVTKLEKPLIIMDEVDKLRDEILYFFITLYNKLYGRCGIVLLSTNYFQTRIKKGIDRNKKGYAEIFSRIGRRFVTLRDASSQDIIDICRANGLEDKRYIETVVKDCNHDLRRVERLVHKFKLKIAKEGGSNG